MQRLLGVEMTPDLLALLSPEQQEAWKMRKCSNLMSLGAEDALLELAREKEKNEHLNVCLGNIGGALYPGHPQDEVDAELDFGAGGAVSTIAYRRKKLDEVNEELAQTKKALAENNEALLDCINQRGALSVQKACLRHDLRVAAEQLAEARETIAVRDSYILNYEHATKIEREESAQALAEARKDTERLDWWQEYLREKAREGLKVVITIDGPFDDFRGRIDQMRDAAKEWK